MKQLESLRSKIDLLKQVIYLVEKSKTREEALERLAKLLEELEAEYNVLLLEDPCLRRVLFKHTC